MTKHYRSQMPAPHKIEFDKFMGFNRALGDYGLPAELSRQCLNLWPEITHLKLRKGTVKLNATEWDAPATGAKRYYKSDGRETIVHVGNLLYKVDDSDGSLTRLTYMSAGGSATTPLNG